MQIQAVSTQIGALRSCHRTQFGDHPEPWPGEGTKPRRPRAEPIVRRGSSRWAAGAALLALLTALGIGSAGVRVIASSSTTTSTIDLAAVHAFADWFRTTEAQLAGGTPLPAETIEKGQSLADRRSEVLLRWMREDPRRALEQSLPWHEWALLPASVQVLVEEPFSAQVDFEATTVCELAGPLAVSEPTHRIRLAGRFYVAGVYGCRCQQPSKYGLPVQGIRLGDRVALWERTIQPLAAADLVVARGRFPEAGSATRSWWSGQALGGKSLAALCGGRIYHFATEEEMGRWAEVIAAAEKRPGPLGMAEALAVSATKAGGGTGDPGDIQPCSSWTETRKRVLCLRVDFSSPETTPYTKAELEGTMEVCSNILWQMSYGKTWLEYTVTPMVIALTNPAAAYAERNLIRVEALAEAERQHYVLSDYDCFVYTYTNAPHGSGQTRAPHMFINGKPADSVFLHEFGHVYGLDGHASSWTPTGAGFLGHRGLNERGNLVELSVYGDVFDLMGYDRYEDVFPHGHYSMHAKACLNWIESGEITNVTSSGRYRIYRFDHPNARTGTHRLGLKLRNRDGEELWAGYRRNFTNNASLSTGAYLIWAAPWGSADWHCQLDTTPLSRLNQPAGLDREDGALAPGCTYTDPTGSVRIRNAGAGGVAPWEYLDLDVTFVTNQPACELFTDFSRTTVGLVGSYVNTCMRSRATQDDWRAAGITIAGTRVDSSLSFPNSGWGARASVGLTHGSDSDWEEFSVQWDGVLAVHRPIRLAPKSDDSSRMWIDLNGDGAFDETGSEFLNNDWGTEQTLTLGDISRTILPGAYRIRIQYEEYTGNNAFGLLTSEVQYDVFTTSALTTPGLTGSYVNQSLAGYLPQDDWRVSQSIVGTRTDLYPGFWAYTWGDLGLMGITGVTGNDENPYDGFSVQWDGWLQVYQPARFATFSDDASRMWMDLNRDGLFDTNAVEFIANHWGQNQGSTLGDSSGMVLPGLYPLRLQYYDTGNADFVLLSSAPGSINTHVWGGGVDGNWGNGANWSCGINPQDGDDLLFPPGADRLLTTNNTGNRFRAVVVSGAGYTLRGFTLTVSNGLVATYSTGSSTVAADVALAADQTFQCLVSSVPFYVTGELNLSGHALSVDGPGNLHLGGVLVGTGNLTKNGAGSLYLEGAESNTYNGVTRVNSGRLCLQKSATPAIPNGTLIIGDGVGGADADQVVEYANYQIGSIPITLNSSGLLDLEGFNDTVGPLTFNSGHVSTGGEMTLGTLTLGDDLTVNATGRALIDGQIALPATRIFNVANSSASPDMEVRAVITGPGGLTKTGSGALGLYAENTFAGQVTINAGLVYTYSPSALGSSATGTVVNNTGGVLVIANNTALGPEPLTLNGSGDGVSGALASTGGSNYCAGAVTLASDAVITVRTNCSLNLAGVLSGSGQLTKRQPGTLLFTGASANTLSGNITLEEGRLELGKTSGAAIPGPGTLTIGDDLGGVGADVVALRDDEQISTAAPVVINSSGLLDLNGFSDLIGGLTFNGGRMETGDGTATLLGNVIVNSSTNAQARIAGSLSFSGTRIFHVDTTPFSPDLAVLASIRGNGGLTKTGDGELSLSASNSFNGLATVNAGTLDVDHSYALGSISNGTVVAGGATLFLRYDSRVGAEGLTLAGVGSGSGALYSIAGSNAWTGPITLQSNTTIRVHLAGDWLELSGAIGGTGDLTKVGSGTLSFSGAAANTYAGRTVVAAGTLELNKTPGNGAIPGSLDIGDGAGGAQADVVRLRRGSQIATAPVAIASSGLLDLAGYTEAIGSLAGSGVVNLDDGILNTGYDDSTTVFSGQILGSSGRVGKYGAGAFTLTGANTYSGMTTVGAGTLLVHGSQPASPVLVSSLRTLGGCGVVGNLTNYGTLAPGASSGILTCSNLCFAGTASALAVELDGLTAGAGHDQVNVRGSVALSNAMLQVSVGCAPPEGAQFRIINNDGTDAVLGTFAGLPEGAVLSASGLSLVVSYAGGTGNDVVLTVTNVALAARSLAVLTGNGNGVLDVSECDTLRIALTNRAAHSVTGITAVLKALTPGVWVSQPQSAYPDLAAGAAGTNTRPFQVTTLPGFACGTNVELTLALTTATDGSFTVPLVLPSGSPGTQLRYDNNTAITLFDPGTVDSAVLVTNLTTPIADAWVSCYLTHPRVQDLGLYLLAPDGTTITLSTGNGGTGKNYGGGSSDAERTFFDDAAKFSITTQSAPFAGRFQPETPLAQLRGKLLNGTWRLRVTDATAVMAGTLNNWSLHLFPAACTTGGGPCGPCPDQVISGAITLNDPGYTDRLAFKGVASTCASPRPCPGTLGDTLTRHCHLYPFVNGASNACVTVSLLTTNALFSVTYTNWFGGGADPCANYLADAGVPGSGTYSFNAAPGAAFVVVVSELNPGSCAGGGDYVLSVTGGSCVPWLEIARAGTTRVALSWPSFASDFNLESGTNLSAPSAGFTPMTTTPVMVNRAFTVTNTSTGSNRFYRLRKP